MTTTPPNVLIDLWILNSTKGPLSVSLWIDQQSTTAQHVSFLITRRHYSLLGSLLSIYLVEPERACSVACIPVNRVVITNMLPI